MKRWSILSLFVLVITRLIADDPSVQLGVIPNYTKSRIYQNEPWSLPVWEMDGNLYTRDDESGSMLLSSGQNHFLVSNRDWILWMERANEYQNYNLKAYRNGEITPLSATTERKDLHHHQDGLLVWSEDQSIYYTQAWTGSEPGIVDLTNESPRSFQYNHFAMTGGNRVVWYSRNHVSDDWELWTYDGENAERLTTNNIKETCLYVSDTQVVWETSQGLYLWESGGGEAEPIPSNNVQYYFKPGNQGQIAWQERSSYSDDWEIFVYKNGNPFQLTTNTLDDRIVYVGEGFVVWQNSSGLHGWNGASTVSLGSPGGQKVFRFANDGVVLWETRRGISDPWTIEAWDGNSQWVVATDLGINSALYVDPYVVVWQNGRSIYANFGGSTSLVCDGAQYPVNRFLGSGPYQLYFSRAASYSANQELMTFRLDIGDPILGISAKEPNGQSIAAQTWTNASHVQLNSTADEPNNGFQSGVDPLNWFYTNSNMDIPQVFHYSHGEFSQNTSLMRIEDSGKWNITYDVSDNAGNSTSQSFELWLDNDAPIMTVQYEDSDGQWHDALGGVPLIHGSVRLRANILEQPRVNGFPNYSNSGFAGVPLDDLWDVSLNNNSKSYSFQVSGKPVDGIFVSVADQGSNSLVISTTDFAGNTTSHTLAINIYKSPVFSEDIPQGCSQILHEVQYLNISQIQIPEAVGSNPLEELEYKWVAIDSISEEFTGNDRSVNLPINCSDGLVTLTCYVSDSFIRDNNEDWVSITYYCKLDRHGPTITMDQQGWINTTPTFTVEDLHSGVETGTTQFSMDGNNWLSIDQLSLPEGENQSFEVRDSDKVGNVTTYGFNISIDKTPPQISPTQQTGFITNNPITITGSAWDDLSDIQEAYYIYNGNRFELNSQDPLILTADGSYDIDFHAKDNANNTSNASVSYVIDSVAPSITPAWTGYAHPGTNAHEVTLNIDSSNTEALLPDSYRYSTDGGQSWQIFEPNQPIVITQEGPHSIRLKAQDLAGNTGETSAYVLIDRSGPQVSAQVVTPFIDSADSIQLMNLTASDGGVGVDTQPLYQYRLNSSGQWYNLAQDSVISGLDGLAQGRHQLEIRSIDVIGNYSENSEIASLTIIQDQTSPFLGAMAFYNPQDEERDSPLNPQDFCLSDQVILTIQGSDSFYNGPQNMETGQIKAVHHGVFSSPQGSPVLDQDENWADDLEILITDLSIGINYIYVQLEDMAGNRSQISEALVRYDNGQPSRPDIEWLTHPPASSVTQAVPFSDALFNLSSSSTVSSGIQGYNYSLERGFAGNWTELIKGRLDGPNPQLSLSALEDNLPQEFYRIAVVALGGNGLPSDVRYFQFRVDSQPPENLELYSLPQSNPQSWYNQSRVNLQWAKPRDWTGVEQYYLQWQQDQPVLNLDPQAQNYQEQLDAMDLSQWQPIDAQSLGQTMDLKTLLPQVNSGTVHLALIAQDYAGNRQLDQRSIQFDFSEPLLPGNSQDFLSIYEILPNSRTVTLEWKAPQDEGPMVQSIQWYRIEPQGLTPISQWIIDDGDRKAQYQGFIDGEDYLATLRITDRAGNFVETNLAFNLDGELSGLQDIAIPLNREYSGYRIEGTIGSVSGNAQARLIFPDSIDLQSNGIRLESVQLTDIDLENQRFLCDPHGEFQLNIHGFTFLVKGLQFSGIDGLSFTKAWMTREILEADPPWTFDYSNLGIGFPNMNLFRFSAVDSQNFNLITRTNTLEDSWSLTDIGSSQLKNQFWMLNQANLDTLDLWSQNGLGLYHYDNAQNEVYSIPVDSLYLDSEDRIFSGSFSDTFYLLSKNGAEVLIEDATVYSDRVEVTRASIKISDGQSEQTIAMGNFTIAKDGNVWGNSDYFSDAFQINHPSLNAVLHVDSNQLVWQNGNLYISGAQLIIDQSGGQQSVDLSNLEISQAEVQWDQGVDITGTVQYNIHGYTIESTNAQFTDQGICLVNGMITNVPANFGSGPWNIDGLTYNPNNQQLINNGNLDGDIPSFYFSPYSGNVLISGLILNDQGLFGKSLSFSVPQEITPRIFQVSMVPLYRPSGGTMGVSQVNNQVINGTIAGFDAQFTSVQFNEDQLRISQVDLSLPPGWEQPNLILNDLVINGDSTIQAAENLETLSFSQDSWNYKILSSKLTHEKLYMESELLLPAALGGMSVLYPQGQYLPSGRLVLGNSTSSFLIYYGGRFIELEDVSVVSDQAIAERGIIDFSAAMGGARLEIPQFTLNAQGAVVSVGRGEAPAGVAFNSHNGFKGELDSFTVGPGGIMASGHVNLPAAFGNNIVVNAAGPEDLLIDGNDNLLASLDQTLNYSKNGWNLRGTGLIFASRGLRITENNITILNTGQSIPLGLIAYYPDGEIYINGFSQESIALPFFGERFNVQDIQFSEAGLQAAAILSLPEEIGGSSIYMDPITLFPDGTFISDVMVPRVNGEIEEFSFSFEDIFISPDGLQIGAASITLPETMESKEISIQGLNIANQGDWSVGKVSSFDLWGYTFDINGIAFQNNEVEFTGDIVLPQTLSNGLAGRRLRIKEFKVTTGGDLLNLDVELEGSFDFDLTEEWSVQVNTLGLEKRDNGNIWLTVESGTLYFPSSFIVREASISSLAVDPLTGDFDFDNISLGAFNFEYLGLDFYFENITITKRESDFLFSFAGQVILPSDESTPELIRGKPLRVTAFDISSNGTVEQIDASLTQLSGTVLNSINVSNGSIGFAFVEGEYQLAVACDIAFDSSYPDGIAGQEIKGSSISFNLSTWEIESFTAKSTPIESINLFNITTLEGVILKIKKTEDSDQYYLGIEDGSIRLPSNLPDYLANQTVKINDFVISLDGELQTFTASLEQEADDESPLFGDINVRGSKFTADYDSVKERIIFTIGGKAIFGETFPKGIAGLVCDISELRFDSYGVVEKTNITLELPDQKIFDTVTVTQGSITIAKEENSSDILITVDGTVVFPKSLPGELSELPLRIDEFSIYTSGEVKNIALTVTDFNISLFGGAAIDVTSLSVTAQSVDELFFNYSGSILLPSQVSDYIGKSSIDIEQCVFSSKTGLVTLSGGISSPITFELYAGITTSINSINFSESSVAINAGLTIPSEMISGLGSTAIAAGIQVGWDGSLKEVHAGIPGVTTAELFGMTLSLTNIQILHNGIYMDSAMLALPSDLGGQEVGVNNARFTTDGKFEGDFAITSFTFDIGGFLLTIEQPQINFDDQCLTFDRARIEMPSFVGGTTIELYDVTIGTRGLSIGGGKFAIPEFSIGDGLSFTLEGSFVSRGGSYQIDAYGAASIPIMGGERGSRLEARASFVNVSDVYPWGLKYATFSYTIDGIGIPLGSTGLCLNGIRGKLGFGPPNVPVEMPADMAQFFRDGTRISLGVSMIDQGGGDMIDADVDFWIDVKNWDFAIQGEASIIHGMADVRTWAFVNESIFVGHIEFELVFVEGEATLYIYTRDGRTKVSGEGSVTFILREGALVDKHGWFDSVIHIPWDTIELGGFGAKFGEFTNGRSGICGWVHTSIPGFSHIGAFISSSGSLSVPTNVSSYDLDIPVVTRSSLGLDRSRSAINNDHSMHRFSGGPVCIDCNTDNHDDIYYYDRNRSFGNNPQYQFTLPGGENTAGISNDMFLTTRSRANINQPVAVEQVAEAIFVVGYSEGNPEIIAVSPSGERFTSLSDGVSSLYFEGGYIMAVEKPEPGRWNLEIDGLAEGVPFQVSVMGRTAMAEVEITEPSYLRTPVDDQFTVTGSLGAYAGQMPELQIFVNPVAGEDAPIPMTEIEQVSNGQFSRSIDTSLLPEGEYLVMARVFDGNLVPVDSSSMGSIMVDHPDVPPGPVENLLVAYLEDDMAQVSFDALQDEIIEKYNLYVEDKVSGDIRNFSMRGIQSYLVYRMEEGKEYGITIEAVSPEGILGQLSQEYLYTHSLGISQQNNPNLVPQNYAMTITRGEYNRFDIPLEVSSRANTGTAQDYGSPSLIDGPVWLLANFDEYNIDLTHGTAELGGNFSITSYYLEDETKVEYPAPGVYQAVLEIRNKGNHELNDQVLVDITVAYPSPVINSVLPHEGFHSYDGGSIVLEGANFIGGSRFYLNDREYAPVEMNRNKVVLNIPAGVEPGNYSLIVENPSGERAEFPFPIIGPDYNIEVYKSQSQVEIGQQDRYYLSIIGENRFDGTVSFRPVNVPAGMTVTVSPNFISAGEVAEVLLSTNNTMVPGSFEFQLVTERGESVSMTGVAQEGTPDISLASIRPGAVLAGEVVNLYGNGMGDVPGSLVLYGETLEVLSWNDDRIQFRTTENSVSGQLQVQTSNGPYSAIALYIKDRDFDIYPQVDQLEIQPGDQVEINWAIHGVAAPVALTARSSSDDLTIELDQGSVTPNGSVGMLISSGASLPNGVYTVHLSGKSEFMETSASIEVVIGQAFELLEESLPEGLLESDYYSQFSVNNAQGDVTYSIEEGSLPPGLILRRNGLIHGNPYETGQWEFTLRAEDALGHSDTAFFEILVKENSWARDEKDYSRRRYIPVEGPAEFKEAWSASGSSTINSMANSAGRVFVSDENSLYAYDAELGVLFYQIDEAIADYVYHSSVLYVLLEDGRFWALDSQFGNLYWQRDSIEHFIIAGNRLILWEAQRRLEISISSDGTSGNLISENSESFLERDFYFTQMGQIYRVDNNRVETLLDGQWQNEYIHGESIVDIAASGPDSNETTALFACVDSLGMVYLLDDQWNALWEAETQHRQGSLMLGSDRLGIYSQYGFELMDLATGETLIDGQGVVDQGILTKDKLYVLENNSVRAINPYSGETIAELDLDALRMNLNSNCLFVGTGNGEILRFNGQSNISGGEARIITDPESADGSMGWFRSTPEFSLVGYDRESIVTEMYYRMDQGEWIPYENSFNLADGEYSLSAYGVDTQGLAGPEVLQNFRIDSQAPVSSYNLSAEPNQGGWFTEELWLTFSGDDIGSGMERVEYCINDGPWTTFKHPVSFTEEGRWLVEYRAVDKAGGTEEIQTLEIPMDFHSPESDCDLEIETGLAVVYLEAEDSGSGVATIEYRLNSGPVYEYSEPLVLEMTGPQDLEYRSIDMAGFTEDWQLCSFEVPDYSADTVIQDLRFAYYRPGRRIVEDIQVGDQMFAPSHGRVNRIRNLPDYLLGSYMIRTHVSDWYYNGSRFAWFNAGCPVDVYIVRDHRATGDLDGWTQVEERFPISGRFFFRGGADIYHRSFSAGEQVVLPNRSGRRGSSSLYFVSPRELEGIRITLPREDSEFHPGETMEFSAAPLGDDLLSYRWSAKINDQPWQPISDARRGSWVIPYVEDEAELFIRAEALDLDGNVQWFDEEECEIQNLADLLMMNPGPGMQVVAGSFIKFESRSLDVFGNDTDSVVQWSYSRDQNLWNEVEIIDGLMEVPLDIGPLYFRANLPIFGDNTIEREFLLQVVDQFSAMTLDFGQVSQGEYLADGDELGFQSQGLHYGFSSDHNRRVTVYETWEYQETSFGHQQYYWCRPSRGSRSLIRLEQGEEFLWQLTPGKYRITVQTGPVNRYGGAVLRISGRDFACTPQMWHSTPFKVETTMDLEDGWLSLAGTENFPLEWLRLERVEEPGNEQEDRITALENIVFLWEHHPDSVHWYYHEDYFDDLDEWESWYDWDDDDDDDDEGDEGDEGDED